MRLPTDWQKDVADAEMVKAIAQARDTAEGDRDADNAHYEHIFDPWLACSHPYPAGLADSIIEQWNHRIQVRKRDFRAVDRLNRDAILHAVMANLAFVVASNLEPPAFGVSLRAAKQKTNRYERQGFRRLPDMLEMLPGLLKIERSQTRGILSSALLSANMAREMRYQKIKLSHFSQSPGRETIYLSQVARDYAGSAESRELIDYSETPETAHYRAEMERINSSLNPGDFRLEDADGQPLPAGLPYLRRTFNLPPDAPEGTERFDLGGRLFGWWQNLPKVQRGNIRIKGEPVADIDFANMALRLAYIEAGHPPPEGDLYAAVPGLSEPRWRPGVKKAVLAMLFRNTPLTRVPRGTRSELPPDLSGPQLRGAILAGHPALAGVFEKGIGLRLMFTESQILVAALLTLVDKRIPAIPMHDGLMVAQSKAHQATTVMANAAEAVTGHRLPILLKSLY